MPVRGFNGHEPQIHRTVYLEPSAVVIGEVLLRAEANVWCNATIRGDVGPVEIGARSNLQDNCVVHQTGGLSETVVGNDVTVGHGAILHGCQIHDRVLIGMGSIVMDNAVIAPDCIVGAGSLIPPGKQFLEPGVMIHGHPARVIRKLTPAEIESILESSRHYLRYVSQHRGVAEQASP